MCRAFRSCLLYSCSLFTWTSNIELTNYLNGLLGGDFIKDLSNIEELLKYADDKTVLADLEKIKYTKKEQLAKYIKDANGINVVC